MFRWYSQNEGSLHGVVHHPYLRPFCTQCYWANHPLSSSRWQPSRWIRHTPWRASPLNTRPAIDTVPAPNTSVLAAGLHGPLTDISPCLVLRTWGSWSLPFTETPQILTNPVSVRHKGNPSSHFWINPFYPLTQSTSLAPRSYKPKQNHQCFSCRGFSASVFNPDT